MSSRRRYRHSSAGLRLSPHPEAAGRPVDLSKSPTLQEIGKAAGRKKLVVGYLIANQYPQNSRDVDKDYLIPALEQRGLHVFETKWRDRYTDAELKSVDLFIMGSPWDDWKNMPEFLAFAKRLKDLGVRVWNPYEVTVTGSNKHYIPELERVSEDYDIYVTPTDIYSFRNGGVPDSRLTEDANLPLAKRRRGSREERRNQQEQRLWMVDSDPEWRKNPNRKIVIKPETSGGAVGAREFEPWQWREAIDHMTAIHRDGQDAVVQPYVPEIEVKGEQAFIVVNGKCIFAFEKEAISLKPRPDGEAPPFHPNPKFYNASIKERTHAERVVAALAKLRNWPMDEHTAVRVDVVNGEVLEVEQIAAVAMKKLPEWKTTFWTQDRKSAWDTLVDSHADAAHGIPPRSPELEMAAGSGGFAGHDLGLSRPSGP